MNAEKSDFQKAREAAEAQGKRVGNPTQGRWELICYVDMKPMSVSKFIREYLPKQ